MNSIICMGACNDKKRAFRKLYEIERIRRQLESYVKKKENPFNHDEALNTIHYDVIRLHFMCGSCSQFNDMDFINEQNHIHYAACSLYYNILGGLVSVKEYNEILCLLAGNFPKIYNVLQDAWRKYQNSGKE